MTRIDEKACQQDLRAAGRAYPRTCALCGLGPCRKRQSAAPLSALEPAPAEAAKVKALEDWHEDDGYCVWWTWQDGQWLGEPSYIGSPLCDDWPDYHTHWSPHPSFPPAPAGKE